MSTYTPIQQLWRRDTQWLPTHVQHTLATPPKGRAAVTRHEVRRTPVIEGMFDTIIPASARSADAYIAYAYYPYTEVGLAVKKINDNPALSRLVVLLILLAHALVGGLVGYNVSPAAGVIAMAVMWFGMIFALVLLNYSIVRPQEMRVIESDSIDITSLGDDMTERAWYVYCYDYDHYDEFVALCMSMMEIDTESTTKTWQMRRNILDAFNKVSLSRQTATKQLIQARISEIEAMRLAVMREEDAIAREEKIQRKIADQAQADALGEVFLKPLQGENT